MPKNSIFVKAIWDGEANVWVATSSDIDGLAAEANTLEELRVKVLAMVGDLLELNGVDSDLPEIPVHIMAEQVDCVPNPHAK